MIHVALEVSQGTQKPQSPSAHCASSVLCSALTGLSVDSSLEKTPQGCGAGCFPSKKFPMEAGLPNTNFSLWHWAQEPTTAEVQFIMLSGLYPNDSILAGFLKNLHGFDSAIWSVCSSFCTSHFLNPRANFQEINFWRWPYSHSYSKNWQGRKSRLNSAAMNTVNK